MRKVNRMSDTASIDNLYVPKSCRTAYLYRPTLENEDEWTTFIINNIVMPGL